MSPRLLHTPKAGAKALLVFLATVSCDAYSEAGSADGGPPPSPPSPTSPRPQTPSVSHEVKDGETLWDIARAYEVRVKDIMAANQLTDRDVRLLRAGRTLQIPDAARRVTVETARQRAAKAEPLPEIKDGAYHHLQDGETIWDLARLYDKTVDALMERNGFSDSDVRAFRPGKPIVIPGVSAKAIVKPAGPITPKAAVAGRTIGKPGVRHRLAPGETVWDLAHTYRVSVSEIMTANRLRTDEVTALRDGSTLLIPGVTRNRRGEVQRRTTARQRKSLRVASRLGLGTRRAAGALLRGHLRKAWLRASGGTGDKLPGTLRWPVTNGWFVRGYGSGEAGYHLAVDIAGEVGWNVRAAGPGIVGYSGDGVTGYGNMVIVIHPGGWVTMYAHNSVNFVVAGEKVSRGTILAEVGSTGISRGPHVHFEFIHRGRNCDPATLFRPGIRHRNGKHTPLKPLRWTRAGDRPEAISCAPRRRHPRSRWVTNE